MKNFTPAVQSGTSADLLHKQTIPHTLHRFIWPDATNHYCKQLNPYYSIALSARVYRPFEPSSKHNYLLFTPSLLCNYESNHILVNSLDAIPTLWHKEGKMCSLSSIAGAKGTTTKVRLGKWYYSSDVLGIATRYKFDNGISNDITIQTTVVAKRSSFFTPQRSDFNNLVVIGGNTYKAGKHFRPDALGRMTDYDGGYWFASGNFQRSWVNDDYTVT